MPLLFDVEDLNVDDSMLPDPLSVITYLALLFKLINQKEQNNFHTTY